MDYTIHSEAEMIELAQRLSPKFKMGDIVALYGTLGVGKTTFVRALVRALSKKEIDVPSPTFTLLQTYDLPKFTLYHFDFYRLKSPQEAYEIGIEDAFASGVSFIEWPEKIGSLLPKKHISITIEMKSGDRIVHTKGI